MPLKMLSGGLSTWLIVVPNNSDDDVQCRHSPAPSTGNVLILNPRYLGVEDISARVSA